MEDLVSDYSQGLSAASDKTIQELFQRLSSYNTTHPLNAIIDTVGRKNIRYHVLKQYVAIFKRDIICERGICIYCYTDKTLDDKTRLKDHTDKYAAHIYGCRIKYTKDEHWYCPLCGALVRHSYPTDSGMDSEHLAEALEQHRHLCCSEFIETLAKTDERQVNPFFQ